MCVQGESPRHLCLINALVYTLWRESESSKSGLIHIFSSLHNKVWRRVLRLIVSISNWLLILLIGPRRSVFLPAPRWILFPFKMSVCWTFQFFSLIGGLSLGSAQLGDQVSVHLLYLPCQQVRRLFRCHELLLGIMSVFIDLPFLFFKTTKYMEF